MAIFPSTTNFSLVEHLLAGLLVSAFVEISIIKVEATYRVYLVVSPDTTSYARVGYGIQDQLILAADGLFVDGDSDNSCPEDGDTEEDNSATGLRRMRIMPVKATGAMAVTLAAAAAARGF